MSGGAFDYQQYRLNDIATQIESIVENNDTENEWGYSRGYSESTLAKMKIAAEYLEVAGKMAHEIDWMVSGDTGEDTFEKVWNEEILPKMAKLAQKVYGNSKSK